jgi:hypothetical protein
MKGIFRTRTSLQSLIEYQPISLRKSYGIWRISSGQAQAYLPIGKLQRKQSVVKMTKVLCKSSQ